MSAAVVIGASSGVGRALARKLALAGYGLVLVSRDSRDVEATAADLGLRFGVECWPVSQDIGDANWDVESFARRCWDRFGHVDALLIPAGGSINGDEGPNPRAVTDALGANFSGPARLSAAFGALMSTRKQGSIVLFSSIAAVAPRTRNVAYSAAKSALETYATGLRHALHSSGVAVLVVALGYVDTPQTFGMPLRFPVAKPERVADFVLACVRARVGGKRFYPWFWWWITSLLGMLPWFVYRRLRF